MGETLPLFTPLFNKSVQIESRPEHLTGESGALIQREIMERSGIIDWLAGAFHDTAQARTDHVSIVRICCARIFCCLARAGGIRMMRTGFARIQVCGWPIALAGEPRHWTKNMYWPHSPRFRGW